MFFSATVPDEDSGPITGNALHVLFDALIVRFWLSKNQRNDGNEYDGKDYDYFFIHGKPLVDLYFQELQTLTVLY